MRWLHAPCRAYSLEHEAGRWGRDRQVGRRGRSLHRLRAISLLPFRTTIGLEDPAKLLITPTVGVVLVHAIGSPPKDTEQTVSQEMTRTFPLPSVAGSNTSRPPEGGAKVASYGDHVAS